MRESGLLPTASQENIHLPQSIGTYIVNNGIEGEYYRFLERYIARSVAERSAEILRAAASENSSIETEDNVLK